MGAKKAGRTITLKGLLMHRIGKVSAIITKESADEKVSGGWIRAWLAFEALAVKEDITRDTLNHLLNKLDNDNRVKLYKKDFGNAVRRDKPVKGVDFGYSCTAEVEIVAKNLENLIQIVMEYGPSSIEVLAPSMISIGTGEAQNIINQVAAMMHSFAQAGVGGIVVVRGSEK